MSENITTVRKGRIASDTVLKDSVEGTWSKENWSAPNIGQRFKLPLHWSLAPGTKLGSKSSSKKVTLTTNIPECDSNWLLTTKYASLPRRQGSLRLRHHLRPDTSLPIEEVNGNKDKTKWISELQHSFQRMPDEVFQTPNKEQRRINYTKQTALVIGDQGNSNSAIDSRNNFNSINANQKLPSTSEYALPIRQTPENAKSKNNQEDIRNNNHVNNFKNNKDTLELSGKSQKLNGNDKNILSKNSIENGHLDISDSPAGATRLNFTPLKGLSSSLGPRLFKSIGIQVESEKWSPKDVSKDKVTSYIPTTDTFSTLPRVARVGNAKNTSSLSYIMQGLNSGGFVDNNEKKISSVPIYSKKSWLFC